MKLQSTINIFIDQQKKILKIKTPYNKDMILFMKREGGYKYNPTDKTRELPTTLKGLKKIDLLIEWIKNNSSNKFNIEGEKILLPLRDKFISELEKDNEKLKIEKQNRIKTKKKLKKDLQQDKLKIKLFKYQIDGVLFIEETGGQVLLGDEMGVGKSAQAIAWTFLKNLRALIICPKSLVYTWKDEIFKFAGASSQILKSKYDPIEEQEFNTDAQYFIINYDLLYRLDINLKYDAIIIDESHFIKNHKAKRTQEAIKLAKAAKYKLLLTGTSIKNRPVEFWTQLNLICPNSFCNWFSYVKRYCKAYKDRFGWNVSGASNLKELNKLINGFYIRRKKKDIFNQMPDKMITDIKTDIKVHWEKKRTALEMINDAKMRAAISKIDETIEIINSIVENDQKVVIFSDYVLPGKKIKEHFGKICVRVEQSDSSETRSLKISKFQNNEEIKIFVTTIKIGGVGITLTASSIIVFNDLPWSPADLKQAEDRVHRIGQTKTCNIYRVLTNSIIDKTIISQLNWKNFNIDLIQEGKVSKKNNMVSPKEELIKQLSSAYDYSQPIVDF